MPKRHRVLRVPRRGPVIFLDANVLFSAAHSPPGRSAMLFAMAREHYCRLVTSRFALEEARRNLADKNPHALVRLKTLANWVHLCAEADATRMDRARSLGLADPMDVPILAAALDHADILVTGDMKHFGSWVNHKFGGVTIMGLAMALDLILSEKR